MSSNEIRNFRKRTADVRGWFTAVDVLAFSILLSEQTSIGIKGDVLEIGVFEGKSAVILSGLVQPGEEFHVCDIFDGRTTLKNQNENDLAYPGLSRRTFDANMKRHAKVFPTVHDCASVELSRRLGMNQFRFIHVDGSHIYENVAEDLTYAVGALNAEGGIIAVDDFRAAHTPGVALAVWEKVLALQLRPLLMTQSKIYLVKPDFQPDFSRLAELFLEYRVPSMIEEFGGFSVLRIPKTADSFIYGPARPKLTLRSFLPPIAVELVRNYLGRRRR